MKKIAKVSKKVKKLFDKNVSIKEKIMFLMMRAMQRGNNWALKDKEYWTEKGWLSKERSW